MNDTLLIWLFGAAFGCIMGLAVWLFKNSMDLAQVKGDIRVLATLLGKRAAGVLHSPDDHHGLDELLERFQRDEIAMDDVQTLADRLMEIEVGIAPRPVTVDEQILAQIVLLGIAHNPKYASLNLGNRKARRKPAASASIRE